MTYVDDLIVSSNRGRIFAGDRIEHRMWRVTGDEPAEFWRPGTCQRTPVGGDQGIVMLLDDGTLFVALRSQVRGV